MKKAFIILLILSACASAQTNKVKSSIQGGNFIIAVRDTVLTFNLDSLRIRSELSDSLDLIPRTSTTIAYDSLRRIGASPIAYFGHGNFVATTDTSNIRLMGNDVGGGLASGATGYFAYASGHAVKTFLIDAIEITHSYDTSAFLRRRDTVIVENGLDSLEGGTTFWFSYHPASDAALNGTGAQILRIYYATLNATSGSYMDYKWKIPLILGVLQSHKGVRADHRMKITLWVREKIPGRVY